MSDSAISRTKHTQSPLKSSVYFECYSDQNQRWSGLNIAQSPVFCPYCRAWTSPLSLPSGLIAWVLLCWLELPLGLIHWEHFWACYAAIESPEDAILCHTHSCHSWAERTILVLVCFVLLSYHIKDWLICKEQNWIFHSSRDGETQDWHASSYVVWWELGLSASKMAPLTLHLMGWQIEGKEVIISCSRTERQKTSLCGDFVFIRMADFLHDGGAFIA